MYHRKNEGDWGALDLIKMLVEYKSLRPETEWSEAPEGDSSPDLRWQRIVALAAALGLPEDISRITSGEFVVEEGALTRDAALKRWFELFPESSTIEQPHVDSEGRFDMYMTFGIVFDRRCALAEAMSDSMMEASAPLIYAVEHAMGLTREALEPIAEGYDRFLAFMLDPDARVISFDDLVDEWGGPQEEIGDDEWS